MKEYSLENVDFKKISLAQLKTLFEVVKNSSGHDISYVKERYLRNSRFFEETLTFLTLLKIVESNDGQLRLRSLPEVEIEPLLLDSLFRRANKIHAISDYLDNLSEEGGVYSFRPSVQANLRTSGVRNLLLELDFLIYDSSTGTYVVDQKGVPYLQSFLRRITARQLEVILRQRDKLGLKAELQILDYERKQLKKFPYLLKKIEHVSRLDVGAGYDIRSYAHYSDGISTPKYIEVKAVSEKSFDFFWSSNEVETSKIYAEYYFLYLLPVSKGGKFNIKKLRIIPNPYVEIYTDKKSYDMECELFHVFPAGIR